MDLKIEIEGKTTITVKDKQPIEGLLLSPHELDEVKAEWAKCHMGGEEPVTKTVKTEEPEYESLALDKSDHIWRLYEIFCVCCDDMSPAWKGSFKEGFTPTPEIKSQLFFCGKCGVLSSGKKCWFCGSLKDNTCASVEFPIKMPFIEINDRVGGQIN